MPESPWTTERVTLLRHLWCVEGLTATDIAKQIAVASITRSSVLAKPNRMGFKQAKTASSATRKITRAGGRRPRVGMAPNSPRQMPAAAAGGDPEFVDLPRDSSPHAVSILEVRESHCRWPMGDPRDVQAFRFCGAHRDDGAIYCDRHARIAFDRRTKVDRRRRAI